MKPTTHYQGNPNLKRKNTKEEYTAEQITEIIRCSKDPVYFIENYIHIINLDDGLIKFKMYDYQKEFVTMLHENKRIIAKLSRQSGKCCSCNTLLSLQKTTGFEYEATIEDLFYEF